MRSSELKPHQATRTYLQFRNYIEALNFQFAIPATAGGAC